MLATALTELSGLDRLNDLNGYWYWPLNLALLNLELPLSGERIERSIRAKAGKDSRPFNSFWDEQAEGEKFVPIQEWLRLYEAREPY